MNQNNGNHSRVAVADLIDPEHAAPETTTYYDPDEPVLKPAKPVVAGKGKSWKRSLIKWCCILLLIGGGALALYLLWAKTTFEPGETNFFGMATDFISFV